MKKVLAVMLTLAIIATVFTSLVVSADSVVSNDAIVDFDTQDSQAFYAIKNNKTDYFSVIDSSNQEHNNVAKFKRVIPETIATVTADTFVKLPSACKVYNPATNDVFTVKAGYKYRITYDIKNVTATNSYNIAVICSSVGNINAIANFRSIYNNRIVLSQLHSSGSSDWATYTEEFTANANGNLSFTLCSSAVTSGCADNQEIYIDNISVEESIKISCNPNNGGNSFDYYGFKNEPLNIPVEAPTGCVLSGWYTDEEFANQVTTVSDDLTDVWALYTADANYKNTIDFTGSDTFFKSGSSGNWNNTAIALTTDTTENSTHGDVLKFKRIRAKSQGYFDCFAIPNTAYDARYPFVSGKTYKLTFDIWPQVISSDYMVYVYGVDPTLNLTSEKTDAITGTPLATFSPGNNLSDWTTVSKDITVGANTKIIIALRSDDSSDHTGQTVLFDNIKISEKKEITCNYNNGSDSNTVDYYVGGDFPTAKMIGAEFAGWYYDPTLTLPASGNVLANDTVYAKWNTSVCDFDNTNYLYDDITRNSYQVTDDIGLEQSKALKLIDIERGKNSDYPLRLEITDNEGNEITTQPGHTYKASVTLKAEEPENLVNQSLIAFTTYKDLTSIKVDGIMSNTDATVMLVNYKDYLSNYNTFSMTLTTENASNLYLLTYQPNTALYMDNIKVYDVTAQKNVTIDGSVAFSGYVGDTVNLKEVDAEGDTNTLYYATEDGTQYVPGMILDDIELSSVTSDIALTASQADTLEEAIDFRIRYQNVFYTEESDKVYLSRFRDGRYNYVIDEIGILVLPESELGSNELNLDTYESLGAVRIKSGDGFTYSKTGENTVETVLRVNVNGNYGRNYKVVGYLVYNGDKIYYGETRNSVAMNYNESAGITPIDSYRKTVSGTTYKLAYNNEFNGDTIVDNKFFAMNFPVDDEYNTNAVSKSTSEYNYIENGSYVSKSTITDNGDGTYKSNFGVFRSTKSFTEGYIEARVKFDKAANAGGDFWLLGTIIPAEKLIVKSTQTETRIYPELDLSEFFGQTDASVNKSYKLTYHVWGDYDDNGVLQKSQANAYENYGADNVNFFDEWHVVGLERNQNYMRWYIDGTMVYEVTPDSQIFVDNAFSETSIQALFSNPVVPIFYSALRTSGEATICTSMLDYIRIYN